MSARFKLVLTADYEVWGNGSGCVENCIIDPAEEMMRVSENFDARFTFFLDVCEYWAFDDIERKGLFDGDYKPATLIKNQLRDAVSRGHDVQLHFHPQWLNFKFLSNQNWILDSRYWRLPEVDNYHNDVWDTSKLIQEGIQTLNDLFREVKSDYEVFAFRAGAWCIQPEENILESLKKFGIQIDSTVAPEKYFDDGLTKYDFSDSPKVPYWNVDEKVTQIGSSELIEVPITTIKVNLFRSLLFKLIKLKKYNRLAAKGCYRNSEQMEGFSKSSERKSNSSIRMLNLSDGSSFYEMKHIVERAIRNHLSLKHKQNIIPLVAISHPKTFGYSKSFEKFLSWASNNSDIEISTLSKIKSELI